jgi:serine phosphatase RsbU (regulator of sigma subunit)
MAMGLMLGISYEQKEMVLEADEIALFFSDGLVEAHNPYGEIFGFPRLRTLLAEHGEEASLSNLLEDELHPFTGEGWEQEDDITLLTLRRVIARSRHSEIPNHRRSRGIPYLPAVLQLRSC